MEIVICTKMQKTRKNANSQIKEGKMRGSRVVTTAILVLMLTAVMGLRNAEAQTPLACDAIPFTDGWLSMTVSNGSTLRVWSYNCSKMHSLLYNAGTIRNSRELWWQRSCRS